MGLMFQVSAPLASVFIILQHNITPAEDAVGPDSIIQYTNGLLDLASVFFYGLIAIVVHAIIQDYVLDKINRKLHLSKTKHSKFNESGQLLLFALFAAAWGLHIIFRDESLTSISSLWSNYPEDQALMSFRLKFYFIIQLSYWLHSYPELYFQKVKREEVVERAVSATLHIIFVAAAYAINLSRLALVLLVLHYSGEVVVHGSRLLHYAEMNKRAVKGFKAYNIMFVVFRLVSLILAITTIQFGLGSSSNIGLDVATGNFNTPLIRLASLGSVCAIQAWMLWSFLTFHLRKRREKRAERAAAQKKQHQLAKAARKSKRGSDEDVASLPEVDQNTRRRK